MTAGRAATVAQLLCERTCVIAYLGASVTEQRDGFRPALHRCLVERSAQPHRAVNAGIGGVGSVTAVFLLDQLVLAHRPDVCVIELTTGDSGSEANLRRLGAVAEGILRKLLSVGCVCIVVHGYRGDGSGGRHAEAMRTWDRVAAHYGVPTIDVHGLVASQGGATRDCWYRDGVHTTADGARHVAAWLCNATLELGPAGHGVRGPAPLHADRFERTRLVPVVSTMAAVPDWCSRGTFRFVHQWTGLEPGNPVRMECDGDIVGMLVVAGPDSGVLRIETARGVERIVAFDQWCHYDRLSSVVFGAQWPLRAVSVDVTDDAIDRSLTRRPISGAPQSKSRLRAIAWMVRDDAGDAPAGLAEVRS